MLNQPFLPQKKKASLEKKPSFLDFFKKPTLQEPQAMYLPTVVDLSRGELDEISNNFHISTAGDYSAQKFIISLESIGCRYDNNSCITFHFNSENETLPAEEMKKQRYCILYYHDHSIELMTYNDDNWKKSFDSVKMVSSKNDALPTKKLAESLMTMINTMLVEQACKTYSFKAH